MKTSHPSYERTVGDLRALRSSSDLGLSNAHEAMFLLALRDGEPLPMSLAAAVIGISRAAMTSMADRLITAGLVDRTPSEIDRRINTLSLTTAGMLKVDDALDVAWVNS